MAGRQSSSSTKIDVEIDRRIGVTVRIDRDLRAVRVTANSLYGDALKVLRDRGYHVQPYGIAGTFHVRRDPGGPSLKRYADDVARDLRGSLNVPVAIERAR